MPSSPFDDLFSSILNQAGRVLSDALPRCNVCGGKAIPVRCISCEEFSCARHGFVNATTASMICGQCVAEAMGEEIWTQPEGAKADGFPWGVLEVEEDATREAIKAAFRAKAVKLHPDVCHEPGAEERFKELRRAYQVALDMAEADEEG